jgi:hypothetical protein
LVLGALTLIGSFALAVGLVRLLRATQKRVGDLS